MTASIHPRTAAFTGEHTGLARKAALPASAAIIFAADAITKTVALPWENTRRNTGAGHHVTWLFDSFSVAFIAAIAAGLIVALLYWASVWQTLPVHIGAGIAAGGIAGNLADRLFRDGNGIIDWLPVPISGNLVLIMNIADIAILAGLAVFISAAVSNIQKDRKHTPTKERRPQ